MTTQIKKALSGLLIAGGIGLATLAASNHKVPHPQPCHPGEAINHYTQQCYIPNCDGYIGGRSSRPCN